MLLLIAVPTESFAQTDTVENLSKEIQNSKKLNANKVLMLVYTDSKWTGEIHDGNYVMHEIGNTGNDKFHISCGESNTISISVYPTLGGQNLSAYIVKNGKILANQDISAPGQALELTIDCLSEGKFQTPESVEQPNQSTVMSVFVAVMTIVIVFFVARKYLFVKKTIIDS